MKTSILPATSTRQRAGVSVLVCALSALALVGCGRRSSDVELTRRAVTMTEWAPGVPYSVGALVTFGGVTFRVRQAHTSQIGWEPPKVPALFERPGPTGINPWTTQTAYVVGSGVSFGGLIYRCIQGHNSQ